MTSTPAMRFNLACVKHALLPSVILGASIGLVETFTKSGSARSIFVAVSFVLFVALANRRK